MEAQQNFSVRETQTIYRTVVDVDMVGYSTTARLLEQNMGSSAVADLNRQIQDLVQSALRHMPSQSTYSKLKETGDGILLLFESPQDAHLFAEQLHLNAKKHNRGRTDETAQRRFRIGIATGEVTRETQDAETRYAGIAIADAVRLEGAAEPGEIVMDLQTFAILPEPDRKCYGSETTVHGKRSEVYQVRKYSVVNFAAGSPLSSRHIKHGWVSAIATAVATLIAAIGLWMHQRQPAAPPDQWVLQSIQAKPNPAKKGERIAVTIGLNRAAPTGGLSISLTSSDPAILTVNGNLVVFQGETSGTAYLQARETPSYPDPIEVRAQYQAQAVRTQVAFNNVDSTQPNPPRASSQPVTPQTAQRHLPPSSVIVPKTSVSNSPSQQRTNALPIPTPALDPEILSRFEDAQGRLTAENAFWTSVKKTLPPGGSLRPEITSQIFAAESTSGRCAKDRQTANVSALSACIDSLNDHLTQLHLQH